MSKPVLVHFQCPASEGRPQKQPSSSCSLVGNGASAASNVAGGASTTSVTVTPSPQRHDANGDGACAEEQQDRFFAKRSISLTAKTYSFRRMVSFRTSVQVCHLFSTIRTQTSSTPLALLCFL